MKAKTLLITAVIILLMFPMRSFGQNDIPDGFIFKSLDGSEYYNSNSRDLAAYNMVISNLNKKYGAEIANEYTIAVRTGSYSKLYQMLGKEEPVYLNKDLMMSSNGIDLTGRCDATQLWLEKTAFDHDKNIDALRRWISINQYSKNEWEDIFEAYVKKYFAETGDVRIIDDKQQQNYPDNIYCDAIILADGSMQIITPFRQEYEVIGFDISGTVVPANMYRANINRTANEISFNIPASDIKDINISKVETRIKPICRDNLAKYTIVSDGIRFHIIEDVENLSYVLWHSPNGFKIKYQIDKNIRDGMPKSAMKDTDGDGISDDVDMDPWDAEVPVKYLKRQTIPEYNPDTQVYDENVEKHNNDEYEDLIKRVYDKMNQDTQEQINDESKEIGASEESSSP